jgi:hypothetical protein
MGKIAVCLAGGLVWATGALAQTIAMSGNPYLPIVARNVFGLNPIPTNTGPPVDATLPKITPNGITDILGQLEVLFKVAPKPGEKDAKEQSYVLTEGQQQDDIEVVHIDQKESLVTFNNHGTVQEIPLANAPSLSTPAPAPGSGGGGGGGIIPTRLLGNRPNPGTGGGSMVTRFGGQNGRGQVTIGGNNPAANNNSGMGGSSGYGGTASTQTKTGFGGQQTQAAQPALSPEEQMVLIANQHAQTGLPIYPPTPYDEEAGVPSSPTSTTTGTTRH